MVREFCIAGHNRRSLQHGRNAASSWAPRTPLMMIGLVIALGLSFLPLPATAQAEDGADYLSFLPFVVHQSLAPELANAPKLTPDQPLQEIAGGEAPLRIYRLDIEPGRLVSLQMTSDTPVDDGEANLFVYSPGSSLQDIQMYNYWALSANYGNNEAINMIMPDAGRWYVAVRTEYGAVSYTLSVATRMLDNVDSAQPLAAGAEVTGALSLENLVDVYRVSLGENQRLTAVLRDGYEMEISLYPPGIEDIYTRQPRTRTSTYWGPYIATAAAADAGDWYVVVRSYLGNETAYHLSVTVSPADNVGTAVPLADEEPQAGALTLDNMADLYKVSGEAGDVLGVTVDASQGLLTTKIFPPTATDINIAQPRASVFEWQYRYDPNFDRITYGLNYLLPSAGDWYVEVAATPYTVPFAVDYTISAKTRSITDTVRAMPLTPGKIQQGYVSSPPYSQPPWDSYDLYAVDAKAGQRLHLELVSGSEEQTIMIYEPGTYDFDNTGYWLYQTVYGRNVPLLVDTVLPEDGTWYVMVRLGVYDGRPIYYTLSSTLTDAGGVDDAVEIAAGDVVTDRIESGQTYHLYALDARQGERIEAVLSGSGGDADLYLFPPETEYVFRDDYVDLSAGPAVEESLSYAVPETGRWYLAVVSYARLTGSTEPTDYTLAIDLLNRGVNGAGVMGGTAHGRAGIFPLPPK